MAAETARVKKLIADERAVRPPLLQTHVQLLDSMKANQSGWDDVLARAAADRAEAVAVRQRVSTKSITECNFSPFPPSALMPSLTEVL